MRINSVKNVGSQPVTLSTASGSIHLQPHQQATQNLNGQGWTVSSSTSQPADTEEGQKYKTLMKVKVRAGMPYWDHLPTDIRSGFAYKLLPNDAEFVLHERHDTHPVTMWKATLKPKHVDSFLQATPIFFSEPLLDEFVLDILESGWFVMKMPNSGSRGKI